ncbi:hypothetical protein DMC30DRAFT_398570 [Rhodotorula diobovata]|uniref:Uncharacterized protein n=1 Tax=Rhodotorula diobovata TaxID=5288 RepID=A0A5C5FVB4_9BASI|nr:hypothetical protein DMC30DRAFT_398570 [Rhodotorula diobovata]
MVSRLGCALVALAGFASLALAAPARSCASNQYLDSATGTCKSCPSSMFTCSSPTVALSCQRGRFLNADKKCVLATACPAGTFADANKNACTKCYHVLAKTCKDATQFGATSCVDGGCFSVNTCLYANRLVGGYYCPGNVLTPCIGDNVARCGADGQATSCKAGYNLSASKTCIKCVNGETFNSATGTCQTPCRTEATYDLDAKGRPTNIQRAQYYDTTSKTCVNCQDELAGRCDATGFSSTCLPQSFRDGGHCTGCRGDEEIRSGPGSSVQCYLSCPEAVTTDDPEQGPLTIDAPAQYWDRSTGLCATCADPHALSCYSANRATECLPEYPLVDGRCTGAPAVPTCERVGSLSASGVLTPGQRYDAASNTCVPCGESEISCTDGGAATRCYLDPLWEGRCVTFADGCCYAEYVEPTAEERAHGFTGTTTLYEDTKIYKCNSFNEGGQQMCWD